MSLTEEEIKAIEVAKNAVAIKKGYPNWKEMENFIIDHNKPVVVAQLLVGAMDEVVEQERIKAKALIEALEEIKAVFPKKVALPISWQILDIADRAINQYNNKTV